MKLVEYLTTWGSCIVATQAIAETESMGKREIERAILGNPEYPKDGVWRITDLK